jgi:hypothetical protein
MAANNYSSPADALFQSVEQSYNKSSQEVDNLLKTISNSRMARALSNASRGTSGVNVDGTPKTKTALQALNDQRVGGLQQAILQDPEYQKYASVWMDNNTPIHKRIAAFNEYQQNFTINQLPQIQAQLPGIDVAGEIKKFLQPTERMLNKIKTDVVNAQSFWGGMGRGAVNAVSELGTTALNLYDLARYHLGNEEAADDLRQRLEQEEQEKMMAAKADPYLWDQYLRRQQNEGTLDLMSGETGSILANVGEMAGGLIPLLVGGVGVGAVGKKVATKAVEKGTEQFVNKAVGRARQVAVEKAVAKGAPEWVVEREAANAAARAAQIAPNVAKNIAEKAAARGAKIGGGIGAGVPFGMMNENAYQQALLANPNLSREDWEKAAMSVPGNLIPMGAGVASGFILPEAPVGQIVGKPIRAMMGNSAGNFTKALAGEQVDRSLGGILGAYTGNVIGNTAMMQANNAVVQGAVNAETGQPITDNMLNGTGESFVNAALLGVPFTALKVPGMRSSTPVAPNRGEKTLGGTDTPSVPPTTGSSEGTKAPGEENKPVVQQEPPATQEQKPAEENASKVEAPPVTDTPPTEENASKVETPPVTDTPPTEENASKVETPPVTDTPPTEENASKVEASPAYNTLSPTEFDKVVAERRANPLPKPDNDISGAYTSRRTSQSFDDYQKIRNEILGSNTDEKADGLGMHLWDQHPNIDTVVWEDGSILTRPGSDPTHWNGYDLNNFPQDQLPNKNCIVLGKAYSKNLSEYVVAFDPTTNTTYFRRVKFFDFRTQGRDRGLEDDWAAISFNDKRSVVGHVIQDLIDLTFAPISDAHEKVRHLFDVEHRLTIVFSPKTQTVVVVGKRADGTLTSVPLTESLMDALQPQGHGKYLWYNPSKKEIIQNDRGATNYKEMESQGYIFLSGYIRDCFRAEKKNGNPIDALIAVQRAISKFRGEQTGKKLKYDFMKDFFDSSQETWKESLSKEGTGHQGIGNVGSYLSTTKKGDVFVKNTHPSSGLHYIDYETPQEVRNAKPKETNATSDTGSISTDSKPTAGTPPVDEANPSGNTETLSGNYAADAGGGLSGAELPSDGQVKTSENDVATKGNNPPKAKGQNRGNSRKSTPASKATDTVTGEPASPTDRSTGDDGDGASVGGGTTTVKSWIKSKGANLTQQLKDNNVLGNNEFIISALKGGTGEVRGVAIAENKEGQLSNATNLDLKYDADTGVVTFTPSGSTEPIHSFKMTQKAYDKLIKDLSNYKKKPVSVSESTTSKKSKDQIPEAKGKKKPEDQTPEAKGKKKPEDQTPEVKDDEKPEDQTPEAKDEKKPEKKKRSADKKSLQKLNGGLSALQNVVVKDTKENTTQEKVSPAVDTTTPKNTPEDTEASSSETKKNKKLQDLQKLANEQAKQQKKDEATLTNGHTLSLEQHKEYAADVNTYVDSVINDRALTRTVTSIKNKTATTDTTSVKRKKYVSQTDLHSWSEKRNAEAEAELATLLKDSRLTRVEGSDSHPVSRMAWQIGDDIIAIVPNKNGTYNLTNLITGSTYLHGMTPEQIIKKMRSIIGKSPEDPKMQALAVSLNRDGDAKRRIALRETAGEQNEDGEKKQINLLASKRYAQNHTPEQSEKNTALKEDAVAAIFTYISKDPANPDATSIGFGQAKVEQTPYATFGRKTVRLQKAPGDSSADQKKYMHTKTRKTIDGTAYNKLKSTKKKEYILVKQADSFYYITIQDSYEKNGVWHEGFVAVKDSAPTDTDVGEKVFTYTGEEFNGSNTVNSLAYYLENITANAEDISAKTRYGLAMDNSVIDTIGKRVKEKYPDVHNVEVSERNGKYVVHEEGNPDGPELFSSPQEKCARGVADILNDSLNDTSLKDKIDAVLNKAPEDDAMNYDGENAEDDLLAIAAEMRETNGDKPDDNGSTQPVPSIQDLSDSGRVDNVESTNKTKSAFTITLDNGSTIYVKLKAVPGDKKHFHFEYEDGKPFSSDTFTKKSEAVQALNGLVDVGKSERGVDSQEQNTTNKTGETKDNLVSQTADSSVAQEETDAPKKKAILSKTPSKNIPLANDGDKIVGATISHGLKDGNQIQFTLTVKDKNGNTRTASFRVENDWSADEEAVRSIIYADDISADDIPGMGDKYVTASGMRAPRYIIKEVLNKDTPAITNLRPIVSGTKYEILSFVHRLEQEFSANKDRRTPAQQWKDNPGEFLVRHLTSSLITDVEDIDHGVKFTLNTPGVGKGEIYLWVQRADNGGEGTEKKFKITINDTENTVPFNFDPRSSRTSDTTKDATVGSIAQTTTFFNTILEPFNLAKGSRYEGTEDAMSANRVNQQIHLDTNIGETGESTVGDVFDTSTDSTAPRYSEGVRLTRWYENLIEREAVEKYLLENPQDAQYLGRVVSRLKDKDNNKFDTDVKAGNKPAILARLVDTLLDPEEIEALKNQLVKNGMSNEDITRAFSSYSKNATGREYNEQIDSLLLNNKYRDSILSTLDEIIRTDQKHKSIDAIKNARLGRDLLFGLEISKALNQVGIDIKKRWEFVRSAYDAFEDQYQNHSSEILYSRSSEKGSAISIPEGVAEEARKEYPNGVPLPLILKYVQKFIDAIHWATVKLFGAGTDNGSRLKIKIFANQEEAAAFLGNGDRFENVMGFWDEQNNLVGIIASNCHSVAQVLGTLAHEIVVHAGLSKLFPDPRIRQQVLLTAYKLWSPEDKALFKTWCEENNNPYYRDFVAQLESPIPAERDYAMAELLNEFLANTYANERTSTYFPKTEAKTHNVLYQAAARLFAHVRSRIVDIFNRVLRRVFNLSEDGESSSYNEFDISSIDGFLDALDKFAFEGEGWAKDEFVKNVLQRMGNRKELGDLANIARKQDKFTNALTKGLKVDSLDIAHIINALTGDYGRTLSVLQHITDPYVPHISEETEANVLKTALESMDTDRRVKLVEKELSDLVEIYADIQPWVPRILIKALKVVNPALDNITDIQDWLQQNKVRLAADLLDSAYKAYKPEEIAKVQQIFLLDPDQKFLATDILNFLTAAQADNMVFSPMTMLDIADEMHLFRRNEIDTNLHNKYSARLEYLSTQQETPARHIMYSRVSSTDKTVQSLGAALTDKETENMSATTRRLLNGEAAKPSTWWLSFTTWVNNTFKDSHAYVNQFFLTHFPESTRSALRNKFVSALNLMPARILGARNELSAPLLQIKDSVRPIAIRLGRDVDTVLKHLGEFALARHTAEANAYLLENYRAEIADIQKQLQDANVDPADPSTYLGNRKHSKLVSELASLQYKEDLLSRNLNTLRTTDSSTRLKKMATGTGMTNAEAERLMRELEALGYTREEMEAFSDKLSSFFNDTVVDFARRNGIIDKDTVLPNFKHYVPATGIGENTFFALNDASTPLFNAGKLHSRKGRITQAEDSWSAAVSAVNRLAKQAGSEDFGQLLLSAFYAERKAYGKDDPRSGLIITRYENKMGEILSGSSIDKSNAIDFLKKGGFIVTDHKTGARYIIRFKEDWVDPLTGRTGEELNRSLTANPQMDNAFGKAMIGATGAFGQLLTRFKPLFAIANMTRDTFERSFAMASDSYALSQTGQYLNGPMLALGFLRNMLSGRGFRMWWNAYTGRAPNSKESQYYTEWKNLGGKQDLSSYGIFQQPDALTTGGTTPKMVQSLLLKVNKQCPELYKILRGTAPDTAAKVLHTLDMWNDFFNSAPGFVHYVTLRESGVAPRAAANAALEFMNLNQTGTATPVLRCLYPFVKPTVQGAANLMRDLGLTYDPRGFWHPARLKSYGYILGMFAAGTVIKGLIDDSFGTDENGNKKIDAMSMDNLASFIPIPIGDNNYFRLNIGFGMPQVVMTALYGIDRVERGLMTPGDLAARLLLTSVKNVAPGNWPSFNPSDNPVAFFTQTIAPTFMRPFIETATNTTYTGNTLVYPSADRGVSKAYNGGARAMKVYHNLAKTIFDYTGLDLAPEQVQNIVSNLIVGPFGILRSLWENNDPGKTSTDMYKDTHLDPILYAIGASMHIGKMPNDAMQLFYLQNDRYNKLLREKHIDLSNHPSGLTGEKLTNWQREMLEDTGLDDKDISNILILSAARRAMSGKTREINKLLRGGIDNKEDNDKLIELFNQLDEFRQSVYVSTLEALE